MIYGWSVSLDNLVDNKRRSARTSSVSTPSSAVTTPKDGAKGRLQLRTYLLTTFQTGYWRHLKLIDERVDLDLEYSAILPGQEVATVAAQQLPEMSEISQREVLTEQMGHPVHQMTLGEGV